MAKVHNHHGRRVSRRSLFAAIFVDDGKEDAVATINKLAHFAAKAFRDKRTATRKLRQAGNRVFQPLFSFVRVFYGDTIRKKKTGFIDVAHSVFVDADGITEWFVRFRWVHRFAAVRRSACMASRRSHASSRL